MLVEIGPWLLGIVEGLYSEKEVEAFLRDAEDEENKRVLQEMLNHLRLPYPR